MRMIDITPNDERWYDLKDLPNEEWKPVIECPTCYVCSNYGRVKALPRNGVSKNGRVLKPYIKKDGYYQVTLSVFGKRLYRRVNRIIAYSFIDNCDENLVVDHIDNNKLNNKCDNLQWVTPKYNIQKYNKYFYDGKNKGRGKILPKKIKAIKNNHVFCFDSVFKCSIELFGDKNKRSGISNSCRTHKKYLGYYFEYVKEGDRGCVS